MIGRRTAAAMVRTASKSPSDDREAGFDDVHTQAIELLGRRSFSDAVMLKPGACSPSRSVVSNTRIREVVAILEFRPESNIGLTTEISQNNNIYGRRGSRL